MMKKQPLSYLLIFSLLLLPLGGCTILSGVMKPASLSLTPPPGPPEYQQGWRDGCETGIAGYGNAFLKTFHRATQDPVLAQNKVYYQVWKDAYNYCATYMMAQGTHKYGNRDYTY